MTIKEDTIVLPLPSDELLKEMEGYWRQILPKDYREFIVKYNGGIPNEPTFIANRHAYAITRFLCILEPEVYEESVYGWYDIDVVWSQISERLTNNKHLLGLEVLPIAELFAGDLACLDFREDKENPSVCVWSHEESGDFEPTTYKVADSFSEFIEMLYDD